MAVAVTANSISFLVFGCISVKSCSVYNIKCIMMALV
jgi:hypothetical protein